MKQRSSNNPTVKSSAKHVLSGSNKNGQNSPGKASVGRGSAMGSQMSIREKTREEMVQEAIENLNYTYNSKPHIESEVKGKLDRLFNNLPIKSFKPKTMLERTDQIIAFKNQNRIDVDLVPDGYMGVNKTVFALDFSKI